MLDQPFTRSDAIEVVNYPYTAENWSWFSFDKTLNEYLLYPFSYNLHILSAYAKPVKEIIKMALPVMGTRTFLAKYDPHTFLYRLGLIDKVSHDEYQYEAKAQVYQLTMYGHTALSTLQMGCVWSSRKGIDRLATNNFWKTITEMDFDDLYFERTTITTQKVGICYIGNDDEIPMSELNRLAQHPRSKLAPQGKEFINRLIIHKLAAE